MRGTRKKKHDFRRLFLSGAPGRDRTYDRLVKSELLYSRSSAQALRRGRVVRMWRRRALLLRASRPGVRLCGLGLPTELNKKAEQLSPTLTFLTSAPGRDRTYDRLVKSELLYQLSYGGKKLKFSNFGIVTNRFIKSIYMGFFRTKNGTLAGPGEFM